MLVKLVHFNPGSIDTVIQSLAVYEVLQPVWWLPRRFVIARKSRVEKAKWWPAGDGDEKTTKLFADNFQYLIVNDSRVIFVKLPGMINRLYHAFELKINHGFLVTRYVTWRCYQSSGDPLLRWMTLGFLGFVLIYALHGVFTGLAHHNIWLFLLYGPASRLVMATLLLVGMLSYHRPPDAPDQRMKSRPWLTWRRSPSRRRRIHDTATSDFT